MAMMENLKTPPMVALVASPGMGHLIPVGEFAKRLAGDYGFSVTFFSASVGPPSSAYQAYLESLPDTIASILLPPVNLHSSATPPTGLFLTMAGSVPYLKRALKKLTASHRVVALVADLFSSDVFDAAREFGLPTYFFSPTNFMCLSLGYHLPVLDRSMRSGREFRDLEELVRLPGCVPFHGRDAPIIVQDRKSEAYRLLLRHCKDRYKEAHGIFVNSFTGMEPKTIKALEKETTFPPLYPIGPLIRTGAVRPAGDGSSSGKKWLKWLDEQPMGSVVFVCFGSGGALSPVQITELAMGLEMSEQRFLWVVRSRSTYPKDPLEFLPEGFLRRTEGVGMVLPTWTPQEQVLAHPAVGGFVSHCGWNSTMESVAHGVPILAWPLYAEQRLNAVMLSEELGVALWPGKGKERKAALGREEVRKAVRELMGGETGKNIRRRMLMLKESGDMARRPGGSSYNAMSMIASQWMI